MTVEDVRTRGFDGLTLDGSVSARVVYPVWPAEEPFPLTPMEAWWLLHGYAVKPASPISPEARRALPGPIESHDGYLVIRQR